MFRRKWIWHPDTKVWHLPIQPAATRDHLVRCACKGDVGKDQRAAVVGASVGDCFAIERGPLVTRATGAHRRLAAESSFEAGLDAVGPSGCQILVLGRPVFPRSRMPPYAACLANHRDLVDGGRLSPGRYVLHLLSGTAHHRRARQFCLGVGSLAAEANIAQFHLRFRCRLARRDGVWLLVSGLDVGRRSRAIDGPTACYTNPAEDRQSTLVAVGGIAKVTLPGV